LFKLIDCPVFAVAGNCDPRDIVGVFADYGASLNDNSRFFNGVFFMGVGGSNITPFNTPFERFEEDMEAEISKMHNPQKSSKKRSVLLSHCPPKGYCDLTHQQVHAGCSSIKNIASSFDIVVCGHIHEARGISHLDETLVVNPGPAFQGFGACIEIGKDIKVKLITV
jgi:hypothetical protein